MKHFKLLSIQAAPTSSPSPQPFSSSILNLIAHGVSFRGRLSPFEATKLCSCAGSAKNDTCEIWPEVARGGKFSRDRSRLYRGRFFAIWIFWHCPTLCPTSSPTSFCDLKQIRKNNICIYLLVPQSNHISRFFGPRFIFSPRRFIVEFSSKLWEARSRLYRRRFLQVNTRWPRFLKLCRRKQHHVLFEASRFVRSATTRPAVSGTTSPPARNFSPLRLCKILFKTSRGLRY